MKNAFNFLRKLFLLFHQFFLALYPIRFICIILFIGCYAILDFQQLIDILKIMANGGNEFIGTKITFLLTFWAWAYTTWFAANYVLCNYKQCLKRDLDLRQADLPYLPFLVKWLDRFIYNLPKVLGLICHLVVIVSFIKICGQKETIIYLLITIIYAAIVFNYDKLKILQNNRKTKFFKIILKSTAIGISFQILVFFIITPRPLQTYLINKTTFTATSPSPWQFYNALVLVLLSLFVWLVIGMVIQEKGKRIFRYIILIGLLFSLWNDNHEIRTTSKIIIKREGLDSAFAHWYKVKYAKWKNAHQGTDSLKPMPVFIVAAEGGASRAAYWTAMNLLQLNYSNEYTFAISSVSGGSLGAGTFVALTHDNLLKPTDTSKIKNFLSKDFISPLTSGLLYRDLIEKLSPVPIKNFDRAKYLEDAWTFTYFKETKNHTLDSNFLSFYEDRKYDVPFLLMNATKAETGQKIIISPIDLGKKDTNYFTNAIDLFNLIQKDIPLKTAMALGARFPFVTPPGTLYDTLNNKLGHSLDGGYYENTGLSTALELYFFMKNNDRNYKIQPIIIALANDNYRPEEHKSIAFSYETRSVISGFFKAFGNKSPATNSLVRKIVGADNFISFELIWEKDHVPLNWYLSNNSVHIMQKQIDNFYRQRKDIEEMTK